ncbi:MAG: hypothetical protein HDR35_02115 [Treponema sp.]|nr:hypothetical protein [Treponema sp.]
MLTKLVIFIVPASVTFAFSFATMTFSKLLPLSDSILHSWPIIACWIFTLPSELASSAIRTSGLFKMRRDMLEFPMWIELLPPPFTHKLPTSWQPLMVKSPLPTFSSTVIASMLLMFSNVTPLLSTMKVPPLTLPFLMVIALLIV